MFDNIKFDNYFVYNFVTIITFYMKWLFLVHQVQTKNSRERVKIWRLTKKIGAVLYRNSVYVLPYSEERNEDMHWLCEQIRDSKGEASVFETESTDKKEIEELINLFKAERMKDYKQILVKAEESLKELDSINLKKISVDEIKIKTKTSSQIINEFKEIQKIDFFKTTKGNDVQKVVEKLKQKLHSIVGVSTTTKSRTQYSIKDYQNKIWTTRAHIHIDRVASAWLIKNFIDKKAKFVFSEENAFSETAIQFDTFGAEFGHRGDNCTFETFLKVFRIRDKALLQIAEIVHDVDLKDGKFQRNEASGINAVIRSISNLFNDDTKTLEFCSIIFDSLNNHFINNKRRNKK